MQKKVLSFTLHGTEMGLCESLLESDSSQLQLPLTESSFESDLSQLHLLLSSTYLPCVEYVVIVLRVQYAAYASYSALKGL